MKLRSGTRLGPYEIVAPIGAGGMGEVYRARDTRLGREVAVKILSAEFAQDTKLKIRFQREAKAISALNHPHICTLHDVGREGELDYLVMELCAGKTLSERIEDGSVPIEQVLEYGVQIGDALEKAHRKGIIHRDLKPSNIMVTKAGVKLLDFGLAKQQGALEAHSGSQAATIDKPLAADTGVAGTLQYMAPETLTSGEVDARSDIYAMGLVLYEMIGGRAAFHSDSRAGLVAAILEHDPPPLPPRHPSLDSELGHVVSHCLLKDPDDRWQSAADVAAQLQWLRTRREVTTHGSARRRPLLWASIGVLLLALAAATIVVARMQRPAPISYDRLTFRRGFVTQARFAPDGQSVIFGAAWDGNPVRIFVKRPETDDIVPLDLPPADLLSVSRTGELAIILDPRRNIAFSQLIGTLARVSMTGGAPRPVLASVASADWSPDGSSIAIVRDTGKEQHLEIRSSDGVTVIKTLFTTSSGFMNRVRFSPSGDRIAFALGQGRAGGGQQVMVINNDGTGVRTLGSIVFFTDIVWSPDGREVWFTEPPAVPATTVRAVSMSGHLRTLLNVPGHTSFGDVAGGRVLMTHSDVVSRIFCLPRGATSEMEVYWLNWNGPIEMTSDGRQLLLTTALRKKQGPPVSRIALQPLDGSPMTELLRGGAAAFGFSADQLAVLVAPTPGRPTDLAFVPVGTGERVALPPTKLDAIQWAKAAPNGKTLILTGVMKNIANLYEKPIAGGPVRRISEEPIYFPEVVVSPDSALVAAIGPTQRVTVYSVADGKSMVLPTSEPGEFPVRFADDGSLLYVRVNRVPNVIYRFDFRTRRATVVREIAPADRAGGLWAYPRAMTGDGKCYCYQYGQVLSRLYIAEGVDRPAGRFQ